MNIHIQIKIFHVYVGWRDHYEYSYNLRVFIHINQLIGTYRPLDLKLQLRPNLRYLPPNNGSSPMTIVLKPRSVEMILGFNRLSLKGIVNRLADNKTIEQCLFFFPIIFYYFPSIHIKLTILTISSLF